MAKFSVTISKLSYTTVEVEAKDSETAREHVENWQDHQFEQLDWTPAEHAPYEVEQVDEVEVPLVMNATVNLRIPFQPGEDADDVLNRLHDMLWEGSIRGLPREYQADFTIEETRTEEAKK